jgi:hypothetical protein
VQRPGSQTSCGVAYKQAFSGIGWAALRWLTPSPQRSSSATSRAIPSEGKPCSSLATHLDAEMAKMFGILRLTICRAMQITVLPEWIADSMNSNHEALVVPRGMGLFDRGGHEVKGPCLESA